MRNIYFIPLALFIGVIVTGLFVGCASQNHTHERNIRAGIRAVFTDISPSNFLDDVDSTTRYQWDGPMIMSNVQNIVVGDGAGMSNVTASSGRILVNVITYTVNGPVNTGEGLDGLRVMPTSGTIRSITMAMEERGRDGNTIVDINMFVPTNSIITQQTAIVGSTIYTNQANRPTITGDTANRTDNALVLAPLPDITSFVSGAVFNMDVDSEVGNSFTMTIEMRVDFDEP